jgi:hypothetical protein
VDETTKLNGNGRPNAWSLLLVAGLLMFGVSAAAAQGIPSPAANQAFLYEMDEDAVLLNGALHVLVPDPTGASPTGLVDMTNGDVGIPVIRHATSQLQGVAALGSLLCQVPQLVTVRGNECTVIATGTDDVQLVPDPETGQLVPSRGSVSGTYAVVVQLDNGTDSPEFPVQTGTFSGMINFQPPLPLGFVSGGTFTIDGVIGADGKPIGFPFDATFRQPFVKSPKGHVVASKGVKGEKTSRADASVRHMNAYYLLDDGSLEKVRSDERALGWPTVRFEITF